jgi:Na+:H+ antiporter, NhaA family
MGMAVLALFLANGPLTETYQHVIHTYISIDVGDWALKLTLHHWINDALNGIVFLRGRVGAET